MADINSDVRLIIKTYEPNCEFNHYCVLCRGKNECKCCSDDTICKCGEPTRFCKCEDKHDKFTDLLLSSIATITNSKIQDNINIDDIRYLLVKNGIGIPATLSDGIFSLNNIRFEISDPNMFDNINILLGHDQEKLVSIFYSANIYGPSPLYPLLVREKHNKALIVYPAQFVLVYDETKNPDGIILNGRCVGYKLDIHGKYTQSVPYPW